MAGVSVGPLIAGQLIQHYTWRVCSYAMAGALVVNLILNFFFMPETAYHRPGMLNIDTVNQAVWCEPSSCQSIHTHGDTGGETAARARPSRV